MLSVAGLKDKLPPGPTVTMKVVAFAAAPHASESSATNRMSQLRLREYFTARFSSENKNSFFMTMVLCLMVIVSVFGSRKRLAVAKG
jgi:hypothetical protein